MEFMDESVPDEELERIITPADIEHPPRPDYWFATLALKICMEEE